LQGLFKELLETLGFSVVQYAARFLDEGTAIQMRRHRVLVVTLGGRRYLVDVGVRNEAPRKALHLICDEGTAVVRISIDTMTGKYYQ